MREIAETASFKRDIKRLARTGRHEVSNLLAVVRELAEDSPLDPQLRDHPLAGNWKDHRECHIRQDWLLVYRFESGKLVLVRTGTHSDLFNK